MSNSDLAWVAGLFEGEGCILRPPKAELKIKMTDLDIIKRFQTITSGNSICIEDPPSPHHSRCYITRITGKDRVRDFLSEILPYLGMRRAHRALDVLDFIELR